MKLDRHTSECLSRYFYVLNKWRQQPLNVGHSILYEPGWNKGGERQETIQLTHKYFLCWEGISCSGPLQLLAMMD